VTSDQLFWVTSRAAGMIALIAASLAVTAGLLMSGRLVRRNPDLRVVHEARSPSTPSRCSATGSSTSAWPTS
jgi:methionine sulfoxide reductase heme-binding subunit